MAKGKEDPSGEVRGSPPDKKTIRVNVVEMGRPLDGAVAGRNRDDGIANRRRSRKHQSPLRAVFSGERRYQGRTTRRFSHTNPQQQQGDQSQRPRPSHRRPRSGGSTALWADELRRRSRERVTEIRRRSREGADMMRRRVSMTSETLRRRASQAHQAGSGTDGELQRLREEMRKRLGTTRVNSRGMGGMNRTNSGRRASTTDVSVRSWRSPVGNGTLSELQRLRDESKKRRDNDSSPIDDIDIDSMDEKEHPRRFSKSLLDTSDSHEEQQPRRMSKSLLDTSDSALREHKDTNDSKEKEQTNCPARKSDFNRRGMGRQSRANSYDESSFRNLVQKDRKTMPMRNSYGDSSLAITKVILQSEEKEDIPNRRKPQRRSSLEASLKLGEVDKNDLLPSGGAPRRRSISLDLSKRTLSEHDEEYFFQRRRHSTCLDGSRKEGDLTDRGELLSLLRKRKKNDQRKTHIHAIPSDSSGKEEQTSGIHADRRSSEKTSSRGKEKRKSKTDSDVVNSRRNSAVKYEPKRTSIVKNERRGVATKSKNAHERTTSGAAAEDGIQIPNAAPHDDENLSEKTETEKKKSGRHVSRFMMSIMCACYLISILLFCALGFWLHMTFIAYNEGGDASSIDASPVRPHNNDKGFAPSLQPSSYNNTAGESGNATDAVTLTKLSPASPSPSILPSHGSSGSSTILTRPTNRASSYPSESPSWSPTARPSAPPSATSTPTTSPSSTPSSSPTGIPGCPDRLPKSVELEPSLTLRYDVVVFRGDAFGDAGGLLCASLEYSGGPAGWIGLALSEALRDPQFGRKEAVIGVPGVQNSLVAVGEGGEASVGQQVFAGPEGGLPFANPGKYEIPAGGISWGSGEGSRGYYGPSLKSLSHAEKQTLIDGSVTMMNVYLDPSDAISSFASTKVSFGKYLREPGEIQIDPYGSTLMLYAVAAIPLHGKGEYDGNPEWKDIRINFLESPADTRKAGLIRKRERKHHTNARNHH